MPRRPPVSRKACPNPKCALHGQFGEGLRPHSALKFGREMRTPAMQAGLTTKALTFREIFTSSVMMSRSSVLSLVPDVAPTSAEQSRKAA